MLDNATHPTNPIRRRLSTIQWPSGIMLVFPAIFALAFVTLLILRGLTRDAGILLLVQSIVLVAAVSRSTFSSRFEEFAASVSDAVADAIPLVVLAWPLRLVGVRVGTAAIAAIGCVFLGAYARVKGTALSYRIPRGGIGAPERSALLALGLIIEKSIALEVCLWVIAAIAFISALSAGIAVWRQAE